MEFYLMFSFATSMTLALPVGSEDDYAGLHGRVTDESGKVLRGVIVTATRESDSKSRSTTTGFGGEYLFPVLAPGRYAVGFKMAGFERLRIPDVVLSVGVNCTLDTTMCLATSAAVGKAMNVHREEGWLKGRQEGEADLLLRQLSRLFGPLAPAIENRVRSAGTDQLLEWGERLVTSRSLEEVFASTTEAKS